MDTQHDAPSRTRSRAVVPVRTSTRRHPSDLLRAVLGVLVVLWAAIGAASGEPSRVELNVFRLVNQLPVARARR